MTTTVGSGTGQSQSQTTNYIPDYEPQLWFLREFGNNAAGGEAAQYDWARRQWANNNALTSDVVNHGYEPMGSNELQQAQFERGMYDQSYNPTQAQQLEDANNYASPERVAQAQGGAEADVANQANQGMGQARQALTSAGITPGSGRGMAIAAQGAANRATQGASAANAARVNTQEQGRALQAQGRQNLERLPTQAAMEANQGYSGMSDAMNSAFGNTSLGAQMLGTPQQYLNIGINDVKFQPLGTTGSSGSSDSRSSMSFARGGPTTGGPVPKGASPSHGMVTDDIDAKLNADEFIIPRDVAHYLGKKYLTQLIVKSRGAMGAPQKPIGPTMSGGKLVSQHAADGGGISSWTGGMGGATQTSSGTAGSGTQQSGASGMQTGIPQDGQTTHPGVSFDGSGMTGDAGPPAQQQRAQNWLPPQTSQAGQSGPITPGGTAGSGTPPSGPGPTGTWSPPTQPVQGPGSQDTSTGTTGGTPPTGQGPSHAQNWVPPQGDTDQGMTGDAGPPQRPQNWLPPQSQGTPPSWAGPGPTGTWSPVTAPGRPVQGPGSQDDIGRQGQDQTRPGGPVMSGPGSQDTSTGTTGGTPPTGQGPYRAQNWVPPQQNTLPDGTVAPPDNPTTTTGSPDRRNIGQDQSNLTPGGGGTPQDGQTTHPGVSFDSNGMTGDAGPPAQQQRAQNWVPPQGDRGPPQDGQTRGQGPGQGQGPGGIPDHNNFMQWLQSRLPGGIPPQVMQYLQSAFSHMPQGQRTRGRRGRPVRGPGSQDNIGTQGQDQTRPGGPVSQRAAAGGNIFDTSSGGSGLPFGGGDSSSSNASSGSGSNTGSLSNVASSSAQGASAPAQNWMPPQGPGSQTNSTTQGQAAAAQNWVPPQQQQPYQPYGNGVGIPQDPYPPDTTPLPGHDPVGLPHNPTPPPDDPGTTGGGGGTPPPDQRLAYAGISSRPHYVPANTGFVF